MRFFRLCYIVALFFSISVSAQSVYDHNWVFGTTGSGLRFQLTDDEPFLVSGFSPLGQGGSAVATNPFNGDIMFYTDGTAIYDKSNAVMANGGGLNGASGSSQPVAICAVPGTTDQYYVFTNTATATSPGSIFYSIVDMSQAGNSAAPLPPLGVVTTKNAPLASLTGVSQAMIVVPNANCDGFWLLTQISGTVNYLVQEITAAGFGTLVSNQQAGLIPMEAASFAYHPSTNRLAVAPENVESNVIIFDFDNTTADFTLFSAVLNSGRLITGDEATYDTEWSPSGNMLYISIIGETGIPAELLQYNINEPSSSLLNVGPSPMFRSYGLKAAPDSSIYHLYQASSGGPFLLGKLSDTDSVAANVIYENSPFGVANWGSKHFSVSLPDYDIGLTANITSAGTCANNPTIFSAEIQPGVDSVLWDFGDGTTSEELSPVHTYTTAGSPTVNLTTYFNGKEQVFSNPVNITDFNLQIDVVRDTVGCACEFPVNSTLPECAGQTDFMQVTANISGGTPVSVLWSNGDTGPVLRPDSAGFYYITVVDASGCSASAGVNVREYGEFDTRNAYWYFGNNAGINFNPLPDFPAEVLSDGAMVAPEGSSAASDENGDLLFYTDGDRVWDKNHVEIATGIGGDPASSQSVIIVPFPDDPLLFYIFTTQEIYGTGSFEVRYSIFDMKPRNGDGDIIKQNVLLFSGSTERITSSGDWLLIHEFGNSNFLAYPLTGNGIGVPVISDIGSVHDVNIPENGQGYMKFGPGNKVAVALSDPGNYNYVELFDFDPETGILSNFQQLNLGQANGQVYGVEFSQGGNKLFASITGGSSELVEYFIDSIGNSYFRNRTPVTGEVGAIQVAPDGQIYVAINGSNSLGLIQVNEDTTLNSTFIPNGFALAGGTSSSLGLPNFVQMLGSGPMNPSIVFSGVCFGSPTAFSSTGTDIIDNFQWDFGDGSFATTQEANHTYTSPGTYNVTLTITNRCGLNIQLSQTITISDIPATPTIPLSTNICSTPITLTAANPADPQFSDYSFLWSTGETTNQISVDQQSLISVVITNSAGCTSSRQVLVADTRPAVDLGDDITVCQNSASLPLNAGNPGASYNWTVNGVGSGTTQTQSVSTANLGSFTYEVTVTDPLTGCVTVSNKTVTVEATPQMLVTPVNSPGCGNNNGSVSFDILTQGYYTYQLVGPVTATAQRNVGPSGSSIIINNLPIGTYTLALLDEVSLCPVFQQFNIVDAAVPMVIPTPVSNPGCTSVPLTVNINAGTFDGTAGFNYTLTNTVTNQVVTGTSAPNTVPFETVPVPVGNYLMLVQDIATTCVQTVGPFDVTESQQATLSTSVDECADLIQITATTDAPNPQFAWIGPNGYSGTGAVIDPPETGRYFVTVSDLNSARCPRLDSIDVIVNPFQPVINIIGDNCSGQVTLDVQPAGANYSYLWSGPSSGGQQLQIGPAESGTYSVTVRDQNTGCQKVSDPISVTVYDPISVELTSSLACDNGDPFTLSASTTTGVSFTWYRNGLILDGEATRNVETTVPGLYKVEVSNGGCTVSDSLQVDLLPFVRPDLPNRVFICDDPDNPDPTTASFVFELGSSFNSYQWRREGTLVGTDPTYEATLSGNYTVDLVNDFGCPAADETLVATVCEPIINAPNAFSPNGNGQNDEFFIYTTFITEEFDIKIYNRWGEIVFQSSDPDFRWNGRYGNSGDLLPGGTYAYAITYVSEYQPDKGGQVQRGGVLLLR